MSIQDLLKLVGVAIVVVGLALRLRTTLVVMVAALVTGLVAGLPLFSHEGFFQSLPYLTRPGQTGIINTLGRAFADNRLMTLFIITLPAIGLAERYGLQEQAASLIRKIHAATVGRLQIVYQLFRVLHGLMGIRLNGHPSFVRPLIFPMSVGAAQATGIVPQAVASGSVTTEDSLANVSGSVPRAVANGPVTTEDQLGAARGADTIEKIKASNAAAENYGNFYGQNLSPVQAGILLVYGVMQGLGLTVDVWDLVRYTIPIFTASIILAIIQFSWLDRRLGRMAEVKR
ncbi:MAG TPA: DUF969 family protein [Blastocatellia bacterium]|nr:DUF969 family protein [Blastocatellia bacterium]